MSQGTGPEHPSSLEPEPVAADPPAQAPPQRPDQGRLQRQTVVMVHDRGRFALLVGLCTLAGVAVGFGLSTLLGAGRSSCGHPPTAASLVAPGVHVEHVIPRPRVIVPQRFGLHCHHDSCWAGGRNWHVWLDDLDLDLDEWLDIGRWIDDDDEAAWLGVSIVSNGGDPGARVTVVADGSPAKAAGLRAGDVIIEFDGERVSGANQLVRLVRGAHPGDDVSLKVRRAQGDDVDIVDAVLARMSSRGIGRSSR